MRKLSFSFPHRAFSSEFEKAMASCATVAQLIEAIQRHYEYVEKIASEATRDNLNASRAKKFVKDISQVHFESSDDGVSLQEVIDAGPWTDVP